MSFWEMLIQNKEFTVSIITIIAIVTLAIYFKKQGGTPYEKKMREKIKMEIEAEMRQKEAAQHIQSTPGSDAHYEQWKAQQQKNKD